MKIENKTRYQMKEIKRVLKWCLDFTGMDGKNLTVRLVYRRYNCAPKFVSGYAYYGRGDYSGRNFILLRLPKKKEDVFGHAIATTFIHELAHTRGIHHRDMSVDEEAIIRHEFWQQNPFTAVEYSKPKKKNPVESRYENAKAKVKEYQSKVKRTQNLLKKWQKKVQYYQKRGLQ